jgi:hypothetical protein
MLILTLRGCIVSVLIILTTRRIAIRCGWIWILLNTSSAICLEDWYVCRKKDDDQPEDDDDIDGVENEWVFDEKADGGIAISR